jgi:DNA-binding CsgD family transcriptional regulator
MSKALINLSIDVKELCGPHFKQLGLDHFNYIHRDYNGRVAYLCSNPKWLNHYLKKSYPQIGAFEKNFELSKYNYILWNGLDRNDPILIDSKEMLGVEFGITLIKQERDGVGFYNLGSKSSDSSVINQYVNNLDSYEKFIMGFQEKATALLHAAKRYKLNINAEALVDSRKKYGYQFGNLYLTERELECINYLTLGKTAEEVAIILNISKRTVETHILNIKRKTNCFNQFRLGYLLGRMGINIT